MSHIQSRTPINASVKYLQIYDVQLLSAGGDTLTAAIQQFQETLDNQNVEIILTDSLSVPNALEYIISGQIFSPLDRMP